jgi:hypothetical protein
MPDVPTDLAATIAVVTKTAASVTVHVEQTSGATTSLKVVNTCYAGATFAGTETQSFSGSADLTFNTGPRKRQGKMLTPDQAQAQVYYQIDGNTQIVLAETETWP